MSINFMRNETIDIPTCVYVLAHKLWGKTLIQRKLRSEQWWQMQLQQIIDGPTIIIAPELLKEWEPENKPVPFEIEIGYIP
jgi:hypothetical protein